MSGSFLRSRRRAIEGEAEDALGPAAREHPRLHRDLVAAAGVNAPPTGAYSPSVFSRTTTKSMSPGVLPTSGHRTPG